MRFSRKQLVLSLVLSGFAVLGAVELLPRTTFLSAPAEAQAPGEGEAWLGVGLQTLNADLREALDLDDDVRGPLVTSVAAGSPAARAGIREMDVIVSIEGKEARNVQGATDVIASFRPEDSVTIVVNRRGRERTYEATLGSRDDSDRAGDDDDDDGDEASEEDGVIVLPDSKRRVHIYGNDDDDDDDDDDAIVLRRGRGPAFFSPRAGQNRGYLGVQTMELGSQLAEYFGVPKNAGVLVTEVVEESPAEAADLRAGDVILDVDGEAIESHTDLRDLIRDNDPEDTVTLGVSRRGEKRSIQVKLGNISDFGENLFFSPDGPAMAFDFPHHDLRALERGLRGMELPDVDLILPEWDEESADRFREHMRSFRKDLQEGLLDMRFQLQDRNEALRRDAQRLEREIRQELERGGLHQRERQLLERHRRDASRSRDRLLEELRSATRTQDGMI